MKLKDFLLIAGMLTAFTAVSACNKENSAAKRGEAGKYLISDASSPYTSIELTRNGEYIVGRNPAATKGGESEDLDELWAFGSFSFRNGTYLLDGFGEVRISGIGNGLFSLYIDSKDPWDPVTVSATMSSTVDQSSINSLLCRHWDFVSTHFSLSYNNVSLVDFDLTGCDFSKWFKDTGDENENDKLDAKCTGLVFTEAGSLVILYDNKTVNVGTWQWKNAEDGSLACDWTTGYSSLFKDYRFTGSMSVKVDEMKGKARDKCTIVRSYESSYHSFFKQRDVVTTFTYSLIEAD